MAEPMYRRIAQELHQEIQSGMPGPGERLPTELELRERYVAVERLPYVLQRASSPHVILELVEESADGMAASPQVRQPLTPKFRDTRALPGYPSLALFERRTSPDGSNGAALFSSDQPVTLKQTYC